MTTAIAPIVEIKTTLEGMKDQFRTILPANISPEKFIRVVLTALQSNPDLMNQDRSSLYIASLKCAADNLLPDGKEAALIPFKGIIQYMPMIAGILKKVRNSGELKSINAQVVYTKDQFEYYVDEVGEHLKHTPSYEADRGAPRLTYATAQTMDGGFYVEVVTEPDIQKVRGISRAKDSGPWAGHFADEMRRKTAIRRLSKRLPMSTDLESVIQADDHFYDLKKQIPSEEKKQSRLEGLLNNEPTHSEGNSMETEDQVRNASLVEKDRQGT